MIYKIQAKKNPNPLPQMLYAKYKFNLFYLHSPSRLVSIGGFNLRPSNSTQHYSFTKQKWTELPSIRALYFNDTSCLVNNCLLFRFANLVRMLQNDILSLSLKRLETNWKRYQIQWSKTNASVKYAFALRTSQILILRECDTYFQIQNFQLSKNEEQLIPQRRWTQKPLFSVSELNKRNVKIFRGAVYFQRAFAYSMLKFECDGTK